MTVPHLGDFVEGELGRVLRVLSVAHRAGDDARFRALCRQHAAELDAGRDVWLRAPEKMQDAFRRNMDGMRPYLKTVQRLAQELDALGRPAALRRLSGADEPGNPLEKMHEAEMLAEDGEFAAAESLLQALLVGNSAESEWLASIHGRLAVYSAARDHLDSAIEHARSAYELAQRAGGGGGPGGDPGPADKAALLDDLLTARELRRGTPDARLLGACRETLTQAQKLSDRAWFAESNRLLRQLLDKLNASPREATARRFLGKLYGLMGLNHFHTGERDQARTWTGMALEECRSRRDSTGEEIYAANLKEIDRVE